MSSKWSWYSPGSVSEAVWEPVFLAMPQELPFSYFPTSASSAVAAAKSLQSCPTLCDPIDGSPSGSPVPGILQARTLEWVAISFSNAWKWKVKVKLLSRVWLLATPWTAAYQAPPPTGFSRQGYWSGLPFPSWGDLPIPGIEPGSPALQANSLLTELQGKPKLVYIVTLLIKGKSHMCI